MRGHQKEKGASEVLRAALNQNEPELLETKEDSGQKLRLCEKIKISPKPGLLIRQMKINLAVDKIKKRQQKDNIQN